MAGRANAFDVGVLGLVIPIFVLLADLGYLGDVVTYVAPEIYL